MDEEYELMYGEELEMMDDFDRKCWSFKVALSHDNLMDSYS